MSIALCFCLVALTTNVAYASITHKGKIFAVEKSDVSKIEVVKADLTVIAYENYQATDNVIVAFEIKAVAKKESIVNLFIAPDILRIRDSRVVHNTAYILNLPKNYLLPNRTNLTYRCSLRC